MSQLPPSPYPAPAQDHPQTTTVLILGICGLVLCQVLGPFAWVMGNRVVKEIDASGGQLGGRDLANVGRILGIVSTVIMVAAVVVFVGVFVIAGIAAMSTSP